MKHAGRSTTSSPTRMARAAAGQRGREPSSGTGAWEAVPPRRPPRITVEVPVLGLGSGPSDYESLGRYAAGLRRPQGLHLTLLHIGILEQFAKEVSDWTKGITPPDEAGRKTVAWLRGLPVLPGFTGMSERLVVLGGGRVYGLEVEVPLEAHEFHVSLVAGLHGLLDELLVDDIDDFILGSPALGYRTPRWLPHVAVGRPKSRDAGTWEIEPLTIEFGESQIRHADSLPDFDAG